MTSAGLASSTSRRRIPKRPIGVLALQGDYARHSARLAELGAETRLVRSEDELTGVSGLVFPGGESTALLRLMDRPFRAALIEAISGGLPVFATCAGIILLSKKVRSPAQESLGLVDVCTERNAYGRQVDSFITSELNWTAAGRSYLRRVDPELALESASRTLEGIFIRAPRIAEHSAEVEVLIEHGVEPVLVRQGNILAATFHPELSTATAVHRLFLSVCAGCATATTGEPAARVAGSGN